MGKQMESRDSQMLLQQLHMVAEKSAIGLFSRSFRVSSGSGELEVADAKVIPEGIQQIVHHIMAKGWMSGKHDNRYPVFPGSNGLHPQPSYLGSSTAQRVRYQSLITCRVLLGEEFPQAQRERLLAAAAADPYGFPFGQMGRNPHAPAETAGRTLKSHRTHIDDFPSFCQTP